MKYQVVSQHYYYLLTKGGNKARSCYYHDSHAASSGYFSLTSHLVAFWKCNSLFHHLLNINQQHGQVMKVIFCFKELIKLMFNWHKMWHWSVWITSEEDVDRGETSHFFCETDTKTTCETHVWFVHYYTEQIKNCKAVWSGLCLTRGFVLFSLIHMFRCATSEDKSPDSWQDRGWQHQQSWWKRWRSWETASSEILRRWKQRIRWKVYLTQDLKVSRGSRSVSWHGFWSRQTELHIKISHTLTHIYIHT